MAESLRPQYHIRYDSAGQSLVWSVRGLIDKLGDIPAQPVPLSEIAELDETYWSDGGVMNVREVADHAALIDAADLGFPIILCAEGRVMDGMHRVAKAYLQGEATILARRFHVTPEPDHRDVSLDDLPYDD